MHKVYPRLSVFLMTLLAALLIGPAIEARPVEDDDNERGRKEFVEVGCYQCHGYQGQGGPGGRIAPNPANLKAFISIVRRPPNVMPAYSPKVLSDEKLGRIHKYLESIPDPPEASAIPLLSGE